MILAAIAAAVLAGTVNNDLSETAVLLPARPTKARLDGDDWCPMPKDKHRHRITDKDGVISCVLCHHVWDRRP